MPTPPFAVICILKSFDGEARRCGSPPSRICPLLVPRCNRVACLGVPSPRPEKRGGKKTYKTRALISLDSSLLAHIVLLPSPLQSGVIWLVAIGLEHKAATVPVVLIQQRGNSHTCPATGKHAGSLAAVDPLGVKGLTSWWGCKMIATLTLIPNQGLNVVITRRVGGGLFPPAQPVAHGSVTRVEQPSATHVFWISL